MKIVLVALAWWMWATHGRIARPHDHSRRIFCNLLIFHFVLKKDKQARHRSCRNTFSHFKFIRISPERQEPNTVTLCVPAIPIFIFFSAIWPILWVLKTEKLSCGFVEKILLYHCQKDNLLKVATNQNREMICNLLACATHLTVFFGKVSSPRLVFSLSLEVFFF